MDERLVVVFCGQYCFLGNCNDPEGEIEDYGVLTLKDVRQIMSYSQPVVTHGEPVGMQKIVMVLPIHNATGPLPEMTVVPTGWYIPSGNNLEGIKALIRQCEEIETRARAEAAGLVTSPPLPARH